ncbi:hypothetical protein PVAG01_03072 [Phlyctema vagabunda]|uniref:DNA-binding protein n=1 Tax=Phlyctema vagabunda TaxID=108571 RepID=A0ABR4PSN5_9HELO
MASQKDSKRSSKKEIKPTKQKKTTVKTPAPAPSFKSAERVEESEDEAMKEDSSSEDEEEDSHGEAAAPKGKTNGGVKVASNSSSESGDEDEAENEDEEATSSEEEESEESNRPAQVVPASRVAKPADPRTVSFKEASPFVPPKGFETKAINEESASASELFSKSNLEGKEIWYITTPASTPLSAVKEISLKAVKKGKAVLSQDGNDYGFVQDDTEDNGFTKIMLPTGKGYRANANKFAQVLHLQQIVNLPTQGHADADVPSQATVPTKRPARQQPKGLKMRFTPIGYGDGDAGTLGSSESEADDDAAPKRRKIADASPESDVEVADVPVPSKKYKSYKSSNSEISATVEKTKKKHKEGGSSKKSKKDKTAKA